MSQLYGILRAVSLYAMVLWALACAAQGQIQNIAVLLLAVADRGNGFERLTFRSRTRHSRTPQEPI